jgi:hypothetical protein
MICDALVASAQARAAGQPQPADELALFAALPESLVDAAAESALLELVDALWSSGWQPAEVLRQGRRGCRNAAGGRLVALGIASDNANRRATTLDARWMTQVQELDLPSVNGSPGWIRAWSRTEGLDRVAVVDTVIDALGTLHRLPPVDVLIPPPGVDGSSARTEAAAWSVLLPDGHATGGQLDPVLGRIRGLLAKAESTTFEAEATALTAKAQELMTRHAIDAALLQGRSGQAGDRPIMVRLPIDAPYIDAKCLLLQTVAGAGRCQAVAMTRLGLSTVVGFADDVAAVELLFTSLLLQAQTALEEAARLAPAGTRVRSQAYRSAFLQAYTGRIGERLDEINAAVFAEADPDEAETFLPVLRSRADQVDDLVEERFGALTTSRVRGGYDAAGWASGTVAGDNARLDSGQLDDPVPSGS